MDYLLCTNVYNEKEKIENTIDMVKRFTMKPKKWLWIFDGSTDDGKNCLDKLSEENPTLNITSFVLPPKEKGDLRTIGKAYNEAFDGLDLRKEKYDFMCIIDVDNSFHPMYIEKVGEVFEKNEDIGVVSGTFVDEEPPKMPRGNGKCVRWDVIKDINEFWEVAPDTFINIKAKAFGYDWYIMDNKYGYISGESAARNKTSKGSRHAGWLWYYASGSWMGMIARVFYRILKRRHGIAFLKGFLDNARGDKKRCLDRDVLAFYRSF